jgi:hypothetical protein
VQVQVLPCAPLSEALPEQFGGAFCFLGFSGNTVWERASELTGVRCGMGVA